MQIGGWLHALLTLMPGVNLVGCRSGSDEKAKKKSCFYRELQSSRPSSKLFIIYWVMPDSVLRK
jgi:hypothetical protein